ncbi:SPOR domain-containing protein [Roseicyclus persicicus]|uniref:SPOR domain-containing protein n=1 Tax=Roseicyclus persicicus TaxID=2650661 RepID=A0A7X6H082_9RHOB|nr:SPOR domain-containing protein [Roseibacterium persicicum]NKX44828.1 SPOR domain-containing protein [Roseibacterium persicicum]
MADIEYFEDDRARSAGAQPPRLGLLVNWAGALVSLGLVVGMAVWAFQLTMRDVSGVPVIRALEGPMRVPPADPGGVQAEHQGLAVNRLAEGAEAGPVPDRLVLAPPPVDLAAVQLASASTAAPRAPEMPTPAAAGAQTQALIDRLIARAEPLAPVAPQAAALPAPAPLPAPGAEPEVLPAVAADPATAQVIPASVPGVARSLRPASRPAGVEARAPTPVAAAPVTEEIDAATLPEGTRLVQLGAFDTPDIARAEWARLTDRFPDYFDGRARVIQEASSGGSAFYRLRAAGFEDLAASRRFCAALMAQNAPCIPVTVR